MYIASISNDTLVKLFVGHCIRMLLYIRITYFYIYPPCNFWVLKSTFEQNKKKF